MNTYMFSQQYLPHKKYAIIQRRYNSVTKETGFAKIYVTRNKSLCTAIRKDMIQQGETFTDTPFVIPPNVVWE